MAPPVSRCVMLSVALLTVSCSQSKAPLADELDHYTDKGDGCPQVVSAISYADEALKVAGQEHYQVFDDAVRSKIAAVSGTIALEVRDFPSDAARDQARKVARLADDTAARSAKGDRRVRLLREYRREAIGLVLVCSQEVPGL